MNGSCRQILLLLLTSLLILTKTAQADSLSVQAGLWETTVTTSSQSLGSRTETVQNCFDKDEYDAQTLLNEVVDASECEFQSSVMGEVLEYTFSCLADTGMVFGEGNVTADGDTTSGSMSMQMEAAGMSIGLNVISQGKRIDDC